MSKRVTCRALMISAPASGQGKTTVTAALAFYFRQQGKKVRVFKTGPDFIDPMILQHASKQPVHQLDLWMVGESECRKRLAEAAEVSDLILIEGVMGLFDGNPSSADLAEMFGIPVLAIIDSKGMAQTFGAVAHGLVNYRPSLKFAGVLANRVASANHAEMLAESLPENAGSLRYMVKDENLAFPSRHLGLYQASEIESLDEILQTAAKALHVPSLDVLAPEVEFIFPESEMPEQDISVLQRLKSTRIGIAKDEAFSFIYAANIECLEKMGAEIHYFSPMHDTVLPELDSLWFPGGYPELYAQELAGNQPMKQAISDHFEADKPILAECGGMLYLNETLQTLNEENNSDNDSQKYIMVGLLPGQAIMQP
ncbi:Cobyrinic acid a,c-diamide synthetase, partial [hydrothermal vent metagenome]